MGMTDRPTALTWHECAALVGTQVGMVASVRSGRSVVIADVLPGECVLVQDDGPGLRAVHPTELT